eukprot:TRINITY_DN3506_c0_g1_i1.p1 TRINITY_DN3506_c0_g1~~TRINITY_DN3506_c0_g1_i1.p1  ORF type:complete len:142 (+),score=30.58 TRINITY_DN3506_c0_g1_i1:172-597(+)
MAAPSPFIPGTASLAEELDKKLMIVLRDGKKLVGVLRSYDQFANVVLQNTYERVYVGSCYGESYKGIYLIRGENVVLLGEIDETHEEQMLAQLTKVSWEDIEKQEKEEREKKAKEDSVKRKIMQGRGITIDIGFTSMDDQF